MTRTELHDALNRLYLAPDQIGHIPEEITTLLRTMLYERDVAAERIARFLKEMVSI
jgi:hypothetical protein